jgi:ParB family chromosome partitioning protein
VSARRSGLGRGLGALIPQADKPADAGTMREVPLARIRSNPLQPRQRFDEESLSALVDSIRVVGILQPVLLREVGDGDYELIAGERRCRAARRAGLQTVPALIQIASDATSLEQALIENLHREDLNALEEAAAYKQLIEEFQLTHEEVARRVGRSRAAISNALRLFQLPPSVQGLVRSQTLSAGHARALLGTPDRELQEELARRVADEGLSVRAVEQLVRRSTEHSAQEQTWLRTGGDVMDEGALEGLQTAPASPLSEDDGGGGGTPTSDVASTAAQVEPAQAPPAAPTAPDAPVETEDAPPVATRPPGVLELEELLADHLNTRVRVDIGAKHGRVVIEFATLEDLERIYKVMIGQS